MLSNFADDRFNGNCVYCGCRPATREHVPPRVFLDNPYPDNLPIVEACAQCNNGFALDEEYMACLIDCVISGSSEIGSVKREKTNKCLQHTRALAKRLESAKRNVDGMVVFDVEQERVERVVRKMAIGHVLYELNLPVSLTDATTRIIPITLLGSKDLVDFESLGEGQFTGWPEVGSRAMQRLVEPDENYDNGWIQVQRGRYRYVVLESDCIEVRMVFSEYLTCIVRWP